MVLRESVALSTCSLEALLSMGMYRVSVPPQAM
jgi:hypothetical protein